MGCGTQTKEYLKSKIIMLKVDQILIVEKREECLKKYEELTGQKYIGEGNSLESCRTNDEKEKEKEKDQKAEIEAHEAKHPACKLSSKGSEKIEENGSLMTTNNKQRTSSTDSIKSIQLKSQTIV